MPDPAGDGEQLRSILAAAGASGTWEWDIAADRLLVDAAFGELYGLRREEIGTPVPTSVFFKAIHPSDRARMRIAVAGMVAGAEQFSKEYRIVTADGKTIWVHGRGQTYFDEAEQPARFTGLLVDVTARKRTEERLRIAQSAGGIGTFEYSDGFATATVSNEFCRLLGLHPAQILPVPTINAVLHSKDEPPLIPESHRDGPPESLDGVFCIVRKDDGEERWIARRGEIVREGQDGGYRLIGVIYDVTDSKRQETALRELNETLEARVEQAIEERRKIEETLRQAQKMEAVGNLTGGIAHDFNNLLTIIMGNIDTATRRLDEEADPRAKRALENAQKGAERAASLTQRLLAFSRRQPLAPRAVDAGRLLAGMSDLLTRSITETVAIQISAAPDLWTIEADPHQLENVILNLAVNARDAMPEGGALTIEARNKRAASGDAEDLPPGPYVGISVTDTGTGMTADTVAQVFDPFFTTKEVGKGTGLGLSMVYGFVTQSGGHIRIASEPGEGTAVTIYLPRLSGISGEEPETETAAPQPGKPTETILVVEDDDDVRAYTVGLLREIGYRVIEAAEGQAALRQLERANQPISLLFTDVVMPNMSGSELVDAARKHRPDLKVLFTSGYTRDAIMRDGRLEDGVDLLAKPFTYPMLASKLREVLDRPRA